jgi:3-oxoacyl-[acyl-carrier-protein] synthase-3
VLGVRLRARDRGVDGAERLVQARLARRRRDALGGARLLDARAHGHLALRRRRRRGGRERDRRGPLGADGRGIEALYLRVFDITKRPYAKMVDDDKMGSAIIPPEDVWPQMDGKPVFKNAVERMCMSLMQVLWEKQLSANDIDLFAFHQANMRINQYVAQQLGLPEEKLLHNIQKYGNTTAATIPLLLWEAEKEGRLKRGMKVAMVAFGAGFTWGAAICDW